MLDSTIYYRKAFQILELDDSNYKSCPSALEWDTIERICIFLGAFYDVTNVFSGTKYPTANLYYPNVFMANLTLHDSMSLGDEYMKDMATSMMEKFQKYWSDFNLTLAIAVVFDPRYKLHFIEWSYKKVYGESNYQFRKVDELLYSTFQEYVMLNVDNGSSTTSNPASSSNASKVVEKTSDDTRCFYGVKSKLLDFDDFDSTEFVTNKKSELELYLEEPRMELDVLVFWRASGRVLDQHRSSLSKDTVEALICTKDWLYADSNEIDLDQLTEDIMSLDVSAETDASNSVNVSDPLKPFKCKLWHLKKSNIVALGTVYKSHGKQMLRNQALPNNCYRVSIDSSLVDASCIPDVGNNGLKTVKDGVGGFFAWPND